MTPTPFRFDGHGINDAMGQRICKVSSCEPYIYPEGIPQRNAEFDTLSNMFAAAPEMLASLRQLVHLLSTMQMGYENDPRVIAARIAIANAEGR